MQIIIKEAAMKFKSFENPYAAACFAQENPKHEIIVCGTYGDCKTIKNKAAWIARNLKK